MSENSSWYRSWEGSGLKVCANMHFIYLLSGPARCRDLPLHRKQLLNDTYKGGISKVCLRTTKRSRMWHLFRPTPPQHIIESTGFRPTPRGIPHFCIKNRKLRGATCSLMPRHAPEDCAPDGAPDNAPDDAPEDGARKRCPKTRPITRPMTRPMTRPIARPKTCAPKPDDAPDEAPEDAPDKFWSGNVR